MLSFNVRFSEILRTGLSGCIGHGETRVVSFKVRFNSASLHSGSQQQLSFSVQNPRRLQDVRSHRLGCDWPEVIHRAGTFQRPLKNTSYLPFSTKGTARFNDGL